MKTKTKAFTLLETITALTLLGIFMLIAIKGASSISANKNLSRFKKAYSSLETTVNNLLSEGVIYNSSGFKDLSTVTIDKVGEIIGQNRTSKLRDAFKYTMHYVEDKIDCQIYEGKSLAGCFKTDDGVVWGIPDTDFVSLGTILIKDMDDTLITAVPITFYVDYNENQTVRNDAFVAAITYDGKIQFEYTDGIVCNDQSKEMQCKLKKYVRASSVHAN